MVTQQGAAGTAQGGFEVRDLGSVACTPHGYFNVQMASSSGSPINTTHTLGLSGSSNARPLITLEANSAPLNSGNDQGHAVFYMRWAENCDPSTASTPARWLLIPPGQTSSFAVTAKVAGVQGSTVTVCNGNLQIGAISPPGTSAP